MAYIGQKEKKELAPGIKAVLKKYGMKGTIGIDNHSGLKVNLKEGVIDFGETNYQVNTYHIDKFHNHLFDSHKVGLNQLFLRPL